MLWIYKTSPQGHHLIRLRFADGTRTLYASLGVYVHPRHGNEKAARVRKTHDLFEDINCLIEARLNAAERERRRLLTLRGAYGRGPEEHCGGQGLLRLLPRLRYGLPTGVEKQGNIPRPYLPEPSGTAPEGHADGHYAEPPALRSGRPQRTRRLGRW